MIDPAHPIYDMSKEEIFYQLLKKEHGYYQSIAEVSRQQYEKLRQRVPIGELKPLLKQKRLLFSCIQEIESALIPLKKHWQDKRDRSDVVSLKILAEINQLDALVKEIMQLDELTQRQLEAYMFVWSSRTKKEEISEGPSHSAIKYFT